MVINSAVLDATWEAWRRAEGGPSAKEPTIRMGIDLDHITVDLRPSDMTTIVRIIDTLKESLSVMVCTINYKSLFYLINPYGFFFKKR